MVEANPNKANAATGSIPNNNPIDKYFEQILQESGYSPDQVRGIANQLAQKKGRPDLVPGDQAMDVDSSATPQNNHHNFRAGSLQE